MFFFVIFLYTFTMFTFITFTKYVLQHVACTKIVCLEMWPSWFISVTAIVCNWAHNAASPLLSSGTGSSICSEPEQE